MLPADVRAELVNPHFQRRPLRAAMIDFDGTLSLLREGWDQVMIPMMVKELQPLPGTHESETDLTRLVTDWVLKLNGQPTINQMAALVEEVKLRQGTPLLATDYKARYLGLLLETVDRRKRESISTSGVSPWLLPGGLQLLQGLKQRHIPMLLASGTDLPALREEAAILKIADYFDQGIAGPESDTSTFTKAGACDAMLARLQLPGSALLNVGDGYVETKVAKERGGIAIGVAYDHEHPGQYNSWRREQLYHAGVDILLPDLQQIDRVLHWLLEGEAA